MYLKHFGLSELPFKITPDPRFLWYSDQHKEAKAKIEYHLSQKDGPIYLSADVGLGKTSIAQRLRDEFSSDKSKKVVLAFAPNQVLIHSLQVHHSGCSPEPAYSHSISYFCDTEAIISIPSKFTAAFRASVTHHRYGFGIQQKTRLRQDPLFG